MKKSISITTFLMITLINAFGQWKSSNLNTNSSVNTLITNGDILIAGTNDGVYVSSTTKDSWTKSNTGLQNLHINKLLKINNNIFAGTQNGVYLSTNDGATWTSKGPSGYYIFSFTYTNNTLYAGTNGGVIISTNNGNSWTFSNSGLELPAFGFAITSDPNYVILGNSGKIYKSTFTNINWSSLSGSNYFSQISSIELSGNNIYLSSIYDSTNKGGFFYSPNYGLSWSKKTTGLTASDVNTILVLNNFIFIGTNKGVYYSTNNGDTWIDISGGLSNMNVISLSVSNDVIYAGTESGGIWSCLLSEIKTSITEPLSKTEITLYPNPTTDYLSIISNFNSGSYEYQIHSITGAVIKQDKLNFSQKIYLGHIDDGVYFITLKFENEIFTKRFIIKHSQN